MLFFFSLSLRCKLVFVSIKNQRLSLSLSLYARALGSCSVASQSRPEHREMSDGANLDSLWKPFGKQMALVD